MRGGLRLGRGARVFSDGCGECGECGGELFRVYWRSDGGGLGAIRVICAGCGGASEYGLRPQGVSAGVHAGLHAGAAGEGSGGTVVRLGRPNVVGRPWEAEGISRRTWYNRKKAEVGGGGDGGVG